jgi:cobalamin biosynthesis Mg chelatase CobN
MQCLSAAAAGVGSDVAASATARAAADGPAAVQLVSSDSEDPGSEPKDSRRALRHEPGSEAALAEGAPSGDQQSHSIASVVVAVCCCIIWVCGLVWVCGCVWRGPRRRGP